jgi:hypothetical protein
MNVDPISLVSTLVEAGNVDTMYRDLYLGAKSFGRNDAVKEQDRLEKENQP